MAPIEFDSLECCQPMMKIREERPCKRVQIFYDEEDMQSDEGETLPADTNIT